MKLIFLISIWYSKAKAKKLASEKVKDVSSCSAAFGSSRYIPTRIRPQSQGHKSKSAEKNRTL